MIGQLKSDSGKLAELASKMLSHFIHALEHPKLAWLFRWFLSDRTILWKSFKEKC